jgi:hypothetical protein
MKLAALALVAALTVAAVLAAGQMFDQVAAHVTRATEAAR